MKITGIVTDSHSGITQQEAAEWGIKVLPMPFYIEGECYYEDVTLSREKFFETLASGVTVTTSQPSPDAVMKLWNEALQEYEEIVYIPISSGLSGSHSVEEILQIDNLRFFSGVSYHGDALRLYRGEDNIFRRADARKIQQNLRTD